MGSEAVAAAVGMEGCGDWRTQLQPDSRQRIVDKIMETLERHLPFSEQGGPQELKKIAVRFEEKIYAEATSQEDYLKKISLKMLTMETKSQNPMASSLQSSAASDSKDPQDPDSSSQTGNASGGDWQEEIYQKIKSMNEMYFPELNEMYQRMATKLQQHDALPQQPKNEQLEKLRFYKVMLERLIMFLRTNKNEIMPNHKEKIAGVEKQIVNLLSLDSSSQTGNASGGDWQEEIYQKIKSMKEMYFLELNEMYQRITAKLQRCMAYCFAARCSSPTAQE